MNITVLMENSKKEDEPNLKIEHGLSLHIDYKAHRLLMDCGGSDAFVSNAERLGVDLHAVDLAVLSHHHYDHGGGLPRFLTINDRAPVYLAGHPSGAPCFKALGGMVKKYIGLDQTMFQTHGDRFHVVEGVREIVPDIFIITEIKTTYPRPKGNKKLLLETKSGYRPDDFSHELIVVMKMEGQLVILTGCAHSGILNMVETVVSTFPEMPIKAVVGGFHLAGIPIPSLLPETREEIEAIASQLLTYPIEKVYTGHCTGMKAYGILKGVMGDRLEPLTTGQIITL